MSQEPSYTWPQQPQLTEPGLPVPPWSPATPVSGTPPPGERYGPQRRSLARPFPVARERTLPIVVSRPPSEDDAELAEILAPPSMALTEDQRKQAGEGTEAVAAWVSRLALDKPSTPTSGTLDARAPPYRPRDAYRPHEAPPARRPFFPPGLPFHIPADSACKGLRARMATTHPDDWHYHVRYNYSSSRCYVMFPIPSDVTPAEMRALMEEDIGRVFSVKITDGVAVIVFEQMLAFPARRHCKYLMAGE
ncbi:uncharacterized protein LOC62_05G006904 [Vanrija pseudolonga]|uniref:Uncharacterized protein n=1 Tax=Vanrija pseudolonga TaxID=143232 RepID=A0AAF0YGF1_9TREE|nr:hypothetical protein LOC62_05G006904 [Vanrija pseudolonga]